MKHRAKGLEPRWKRGDGERENKEQPKISHLLMMLQEMFGPVAALCVLSCFQPGSPCLSSRKKRFKMTHRSNADPLSNSRGLMAWIWGEWDKPCDSFGTETILLPRAFCTDFRHLLPYSNRGETDLYGQRSRKSQMRGKKLYSLA